VQALPNILAAMFVLTSQTVVEQTAPSARFESVSVSIIHHRCVAACSVQTRESLNSSCAWRVNPAVHVMRAKFIKSDYEVDLMIR